MIELRSSDAKINVSSLRDNLKQMNLGDVSVKNFGNETDYLIKFENNNNNNVIEEIKANLDKSFGNNFNFRRVENVGPKVSAELLQSGVIAIYVSANFIAALISSFVSLGSISISAKDLNSSICLLISPIILNYLILLLCLQEL